MVLGHPGGFADQDAIMDVDSLFKVQVLQSPGGGFTLCKGGKNSPLEQELVAHILARCSTPVDLGGSASFEVAVFRRQRHAGIQVYWSLLDLHSLLLLSHAWPSKWVHKSMQPWRTYMEGMLCCADQFIWSNCLGGSHIDKLAWSLRCLPWPGVSTSALLALLGRFCCSCKMLGGLQDISLFYHGCYVE